LLDEYSGPINNWQLTVSFASNRHHVEYISLD
jgi:hypothetical protein